MAPLAPPVSKPLSKIRDYAHPQYIITLVSGAEAKQFLVKLFLKRDFNLWIIYESRIAKSPTLKYWLLYFSNLILVNFFHSYVFKFATTFLHGIVLSFFSMKMVVNFKSHGRKQSKSIYLNELPVILNIF